jgi:hypothetical protein
MTGEILDSDVDYAQRLIAEGRLDNEVVEALGLRGIEPAKSMKLVADLRSGLKIRPNMILLPKRGSLIR